MGSKTRWALLACAGLFAAASLLCGQESKPTVRHHRVEEAVPDDSSAPEVAQAETAMEHGDLATAESLLQKAAKDNPNDYRPWFDLGYVYNATRRAPQAIEAYRKSAALKPEVFETNLNLGILLAGQNENAEAAKYLRAATQLKPQSKPEAGLSRAWQWLGITQQNADPQQAMAAFAEASKLSPQDAQPHLYAANVLEKPADWRAAALEYQKAVELDPKSKPARTGLANAYVKQKKYPEAEAVLRDLLAADPQDSHSRVQLVQVLVAEGRNDAAAEELQKTSTAGQQDPQAALQLGSLYVSAGKYVEAEQEFRFALQKMPNDSEAHLALGSLLMHMKKYPESQQELLAAIRLKPDVAEAYGNLAVVAAENKNYPLTLKALDYRARLLPEDAASYFLRATTYDNLKQVPQAVEYYQRFLEASAGKLPDQEWQARHRLMALDPKHAEKYTVKK